MSLKRMISIGLFVIAIVPILLTSAIQMVTINYWSQDLIGKNLVDSAHSFKAIIEDFFTQQAIDLSIVSHFTEVKEYLVKPSEEMKLEVQNKLYQRIIDKYFIDFYLLYDAKGDLVATTNSHLLTYYPHLPEEYTDLKTSEVRYSDYIAHPIYEQQSGAILAFTPIVVRGETIGYLGVGYNNTYFTHIIENVSLDNNVKVRLEDSRGRVVSTLGLFVLQAGQPNNFDEAVAKIDFEKEPTGIITFDNYKYEEIAYYTPIEKTGLRLYASVNLLDYKYPSHKALEHIIIILGAVAFVVILIVIRISSVINRYMENILDTMIQIKNGDFKVRLSIPTNNEVKYVADTFNDLLSAIEHNNNELYQSSERYRTAVKMFSEVFFELDIVKDEIEFGATKWTSYYQLDKKHVYSNTFAWFRDNFVYEEDRSHFIETFDRDVLLERFKEMESGKVASVMLEFRWANPKGLVQWISTTMVPIYDQNGMMSSMVGYIKNIHDQKNKELDLMIQAQQDGLTKINNKITTQRLIEEALSLSHENQTHALLIVDLDDFKAVNDTHGHLVGDDVLRDVSQLLRSLFRSSDIIGRIGGDEFMVFMHDINRSVVEKKAEAMVLALGHRLDQPHGDIMVSCSIGIAMYPDKGAAFMELFEAADKALYEAKEAGKNQYRF